MKTITIPLNQTEEINRLRHQRNVWRLAAIISSAHSFISIYALIYLLLRNCP